MDHLKILEVQGLDPSECNVDRSDQAIDRSPRDINQRSSLNQLHAQQQADANNAAALVRNIASFLSFTDAAALQSIVPTLSTHVPYHEDEIDTTPADSWAVGVEFDGSSWSIDTPPTPALIAISPGATPTLFDDLEPDETVPSLVDRQDGHPIGNMLPESLGGLLRERRRRWAQEKITAAVFAHPRPLRSYCVDAFDAAMKIRQQQSHKLGNREFDPETLREPCLPNIRKRKRTKQEKSIQVIRGIVEVVFQNVPLSVVIDILENLGGLSHDTTVASFHLSIFTINHVVVSIGRTVQAIWKCIKSFNPLQLLEAIISLQFNAMGKTSEVLASGIQSVATGVGSASSMALYRLSTANLTAVRQESSSSLAGNANQVGRRSSSNDAFKKKLLRKLSKINDAARVVSYRETEDDTGGLTRQAVSRTRRMMHYTVPLRPFVATVTLSQGNSFDDVESERTKRFSDFSSGNLSDYLNLDSSSASSAEEEESPFMCTPQSFPPTPHSRQLVIAQRSQFSDDVIFIARDRLRVHDGLKSDDERTRERSRALEDEKRLAVFACKDPSRGIQLTCGRHIATKLGHMYYASTRSMIPILRNCFVYFELTVLPQSIISAAYPPTLATLSIGLSTEEMPPNTLVGAWQGSVGLCTTGQMLIAGQWCSPADPVMSSYGSDSTVGCLVYLDDESAFETWDGVMLKAFVRFNVNGILVSQPETSLPMLGSPGSQPHPATIAASENRDDNSDKASSTSKLAQSATLTLLVSASEDLYPTVTLQSAGTAVVCRFSSEDIAANSRYSIGAPDEVVVYAVDGSIILNSDE